MSIIISKEGTKAIKLDKIPFEKEDFLQDYIHKNPESIPVYEIQEDKRLFVSAREFPTESGSIDALAIDKDGDIYIVETKLYKNSDKRVVLAQALDYGASLWKHYGDFGEFLTLLNDKVQSKFKMTFEEKVKEFFDLEDEQYRNLVESLRLNLREGNIKFVILMDSIDERLKDLILYVNSHSKFDIYAVQLEYYKFDQYEIMVPKIFGVEVTKSVSSSGNGSRRNWDKETFLNDAKEKGEKEYGMNLLSSLLDFTEKNADLLEYGTGKDVGSFTYRFEDNRSKSGFVSIFTVYSSGVIQFRFTNIKKNLGEKYPELYDSKLSKVIAKKSWNKEEVVKEKGFGPTIPLIEAFPKEGLLQSFKSMILEYVAEVKKEGEESQN